MFKGRFFLVFISLLLFLASGPYLAESIMGGVIMQITFTVVLLLGVYAINRNRVLLVVAVSLVLPILVSRWVTTFVFVPTLHVTGSVFGVLFFAFLAISVLYHILLGDHMTADEIFGAVSGYLYIGLAWSFIFLIIESAQPGSFSFSNPGAFEGASGFAISPFVYHSFVTLTTLGYGDITPNSPSARTFSYLEAIIGQIYLIVLIARLVGLHIAGRGKKQSSHE